MSKLEDEVAEVHAMLDRWRIGEGTLLERVREARIGPKDPGPDVEVAPILNDLVRDLMARAPPVMEVKALNLDADVQRWRDVAHHLAEQVVLMYGELAAFYGEVEWDEVAGDWKFLGWVRNSLVEMPERGEEVDEDEWVREATGRVLEVAHRALATDGKVRCEECDGVGYHVEVVSHAEGVEQVRHRCESCDGEGVLD